MRYLTAIISCAACLLAYTAAYGTPDRTPLTDMTPAAASVTSAAAIPATSPAATDYSLPELGIAGGTALPLWKAHFIGQQVYHLIQGEGGVMNDPLVDNYINHLGHRLSSVAQGPDEPYHYFVVRAPDINAFALPGAFVGVNYGLILATRSEDELAGVMAHETAHVAQRHIARQLADATYNDLINIAILLGGVTAAIINPGIAVGAMMGAQGGIAQRGLNYTRAHEMEADRVGILILARARFNPMGMVDFFKYMERDYSLQGYQMPEFLSTHPLDITRIAEGEIRAKNLHPNVLPENPNYALMRARIRVLTSNDLVNTLNWFKGDHSDNPKLWYREADIYGMALCYDRLDSGNKGLALIRPLAKAHPNNIAIQLALAESLLAAGEKTAGMNALEQDYNLFPGNRPVLMTYARALYNAGDARKTVRILRPYMDPSNHVINPDLYKLLANAANKTGRRILSLRAMANVYELQADYQSSIIQLRIALRDKNLTPVQKQQIEKQKDAVTEEHKRAKKMGLVDNRSDQALP